MNKKMAIIFVAILLGIVEIGFAAAPDWTVIAPGGDIQTAIDNVSTNGGVVYLNAGTYNISSTIQVKSKVTLMGAGRAATIINYTGTGAALEVNNTSGVYNWVIKDLRVTATQGAHAISLNYAREGRIENIKIVGAFSTTGIRFDNGSWSNRIINCQITGITGDGIFLGPQSNAIMVSGCQITSNTGDGVQVSYANGCQLTSNQIEGNGKGIHIAAVGGASTVFGLKINNNYFENNPIYINEEHGYSQRVENLTISDNYMWCNGANYAVISDNPNGIAFGILSGNHFWGVNIAGVQAKNAGDRLLVTGARSYGPGWDTGSTKPLLDKNNDTSASSSLLVDYKKVSLDSALRLIPKSAGPSSPQEGDMYFNSTTHRLMVYDGTAWKTVTVN